MTYSSHREVAVGEKILFHCGWFVLSKKFLSLSLQSGFWFITLQICFVLWDLIHHSIDLRCFSLRASWERALCSLLLGCYLDFLSFSPQFQIWFIALQISNWSLHNILFWFSKTRDQGSLKGFQALFVKSRGSLSASERAEGISAFVLQGELEEKGKRKLEDELFAVQRCGHIETTCVNRKFCFTFVFVCFEFQWCIYNSDLIVDCSCWTWSHGCRQLEPNHVKISCVLFVVFDNIWMSLKLT